MAALRADKVYALRGRSVNILSLFRRRPQVRTKRVLTPEARAQQAAAMNAQSAQQVYGAGQSSAP
jgi:hypothetical protein